jgi:hypothetical protein
MTKSVGIENLPLAFYAVVCGLLSLAAPHFGGMLPRVVVGAFVGVCSAIALPSILGLMS